MKAIKIILILILFSSFFSLPTYACMSLAKDPYVTIAFDDATSEGARITQDGYYITLSPGNVILYNFYWGGGGGVLNPEDENDDRRKVFWDIVTTSMSNEEINSLYNDLKNINDLEVDKTTDKINAKFVYHYNYEDGIGLRLEQEKVAEVENAFNKNRKILFNRSYVSAELALDCNITNSHFAGGRPENWIDNCQTNPDTFDWKTTFKNELVSMINDGIISGTYTPDVEGATNVINGYDITIANFDSPEDKICELNGWKVVKNNEERYLEDSCYKLREQTAVKGCRGSSEASLFGISQGGGPISFIAKIINFFSNLFSKIFK